MPCSSVRAACAGSSSRWFPLAWSMASRRVIARPRSHCSANAASPTRERRVGEGGRRVGPAELVVQPGPRNLAEQCGAGVQPNGERRLSVSGGEPRRHLERDREPNVMAALAFDRERLGEPGARRLGVTRLEREQREVERECETPCCVVQASVDGQALVEQAPGPCVIAAHQREPASDFCDVADAPGISEPPCQVDGLLDRSLGFVEFPLRRETHADLPESGRLHVGHGLPCEPRRGPPGSAARAESVSPAAEGDHAEKSERVRDHAVVAVSAVHREALFEHPTRRLEVALVERQRCDLGLRLRAGGRRAGAEREQVLQALAALLHEAPQLPVAPERRADPEADVRFACLQRPAERSADVVALCVETLEPLALLGAEQARLGLPRQARGRSRRADGGRPRRRRAPPDARARTRGWSRASPGEARRRVLARS